MTVINPGGSAAATAQPNYFGPNLVAPYPTHAATGSAALGANTLFAIRVTVPKAGTLRDLGAFVSTPSGNVRAGVYDTGDALAGSRTRLFDSGSVASAAGGLVVVGDPALTVTAGQQLDLAVLFDNGTANVRFTNISVAPTYPTNFWVAAGGATAKLAWTNSPGGFTLPATVTEANCTGTGSAIFMFARVA